MNTADLIARMDAQRSQWVDLPGGKRLVLTLDEHVEV